jgi:hypothetical protein
MHAFILQDWTTIRGGTNINVTQSADQWLDLTAYQDVVFYVDCREFTGTTPQIGFQTSPTNDESLFTNIVAPTNFTTAGVQVSKVILSTNPAVPLGRYVRWQITGSTTNVWDATFRVLVAANAPGM